MALETQFPFFSPPKFRPLLHHRVTEIRFSRWNNANAREFNLRQRTQKELEDQILFEKRFDAALAITHNYNPAPPHPTTRKHSTGTPSAPSSPSIPGKSSKYSKPPNSSPAKTVHPAFKPLVKPRKIPAMESRKESEGSPQPNFRIDEHGVSYEMPEAPFLYQYSYTETPKLKPLKLREPLVSPFGPSTMAKPWMGKKPMAKKALPEFDSFKLPPPHKKGVKSVQAPGPFLAGSGPKYVMSREEIMGEPLTKEEIWQLILSCKKSRRQLNMGRDGLTHNMLDNIHALWKRRRVCKIKCLGVCTIDMKNICEHLEEKTGGKIIYSRGGTLYLFRGRNYNHKTRPRFPLMLWKPATPVYPRLIKHVPEGLTLDEVREMRKKGRQLTPICKLAKNGFYTNLVRTVREAFEICELVRINCEGLNPSDFKKIGGKLQSLVPCVLISFEREHILMWRGRDWKPSLIDNTPQIPNEASELKAGLTSEPTILAVDLNSLSTSSSDDLQRVSEPSIVVVESHSQETSSSLDEESLLDSELINVETEGVAEETISAILNAEEIHASEGSVVLPLEAIDQSTESQLEDTESQETSSDLTCSENVSPVSSDKQSVHGILLLRKQAIENGMAIAFDDQKLDADLIFRKAVAFSKTSPPGPIFRTQPKRVIYEISNAQVSNDSESKQAETVSRARRLDPNSQIKPRRMTYYKSKAQISDESEQKQVDPVARTRGIIVSGKRDNKLKTLQTPRMDFVKADHLGETPHGSLRIDELAKLLA